ncbi:MAG: LysM peptidoglycan-binding domain-containing protein [Bacillota bacterium]|nr:LysM peptidoglycan-binding domain-containing protein [Bacillota bacterium]
MKRMLAFLATAVFLWGLAYWHPAGAEGLREPATVVVQPGDTLWQLATRYASPREDLRRWIDRVMEHNHLQSPLIYPGQVLEIP